MKCVKTLGVGKAKTLTVINQLRRRASQFCFLLQVDTFLGFDIRPKSVFDVCYFTNGVSNPN
jgi:hypothetical protein